MVCVRIPCAHYTRVWRPELGPKDEDEEGEVGEEEVEDNKTNEALPYPAYPLRALPYPPYPFHPPPYPTYPIHLPPSPSSPSPLPYNPYANKLASQPANHPAQPASQSAN